jgi:hypothetical protein
MRPSKSILEACSVEHSVGEKISVQHLEEINGELCSEGKDAATTITRLNDGWVWHCHRCKNSGFIAEDALSPSEVVNRIKTKREVRNCSAANHMVSLPRDFVRINDTYQSDIPMIAYDWLFANNVFIADIKAFGIGWSSSMGRIVFPIYDWGFFGKTPATKLIGWVARCVQPLNKEERKAQKRPKYLTQKSKEYKHPVWIVPEGKVYPELKDYVVVVEDIISAIKVNKATGVCCVALLTTYFPKEVYNSFKDKTILFWLDPDQKQNMVSLIMKVSSWGGKAARIWTDHDPKVYFYPTISRILLEKQKAVEV